MNESRRGVTRWPGITLGLHRLLRHRAVLGCGESVVSAALWTMAIDSGKRLVRSQETEAYIQ